MTLVEDRIHCLEEKGKICYRKEEKWESEREDEEQKRLNSFS